MCNWVRVMGIDIGLSQMPLYSLCSVLVLTKAHIALDKISALYRDLGISVTFGTCPQNHAVYGMTSFNLYKYCALWWWVEGSHLTAWPRYSSNRHGGSSAVYGET